VNPILVAMGPSVIQTGNQLASVQSIVLAIRIAAVKVREHVCNGSVYHC